MTNIQQLVAQLASPDRVQAFQARRQLQAEIERLSDPRRARDLSALADTLVAELIATTSTDRPQLTNVPDDVSATLVPKHPVEVRRLLCQLLSPIAADAQVPRLATALADLEIRDLVCGVLGQIPTLVSNQALVKAASQPGPEFRIGLLNVLGSQRSRDAMSALMRAASDSDLEVRLAALEGLANFPEADNDRLFVAATQLDLPRYRARACKARLRFAETLRRSGEYESATAIYQTIESAALAGPWTRAARLALSKMKTAAG